MKQKKVVTLLICTMFISSAILGVKYWKDNRWKSIFDVKYVDYFQGDEIHPYTQYDLYEITNTTKNTLKNVYATIQVIPAISTIYETFTYKDYVEVNFKPGQTIEYRIYWHDMRKEAENQDIKLSVCTLDIVGFTWN